MEYPQIKSIPPPAVFTEDDRARLVRIESRLCQLMQHMGMDPHEHIDDPKEALQKDGEWVTVRGSRFGITGRRVWKPRDGGK